MLSKKIVNPQLSTLLLKLCLGVSPAWPYLPPFSSTWANLTICGTELPSYWNNKLLIQYRVTS